MKNDITVYLFQTVSHSPKEVSQAAYCFVRQHIAEVTGSDPERLVFGRTGQGKPYIEKEGICFNLSHSGNTVAIALSECEIGVDIEEVRPANLRIAERYFAESDRRYLALAADEQDKLNRFFALWTAKEAYLKRYGAGLSGGLDFSVADENGLLTRVASEGFPPAGIFYRCLCGEDFGLHAPFHTASGSVRYILSVCADRTENVFLNMII